MATETVTLDDPEMRLRVVAKLCSSIAQQIDSAKAVLSDSDGDSIDLTHLIISILGQVGWIADRAATIAGQETPIRGAAEAWVLDEHTHKMLRNLGKGR